eukprot:g1213.t1
MSSTSGLLMTAPAVEHVVEGQLQSPLMVDEDDSKAAAEQDDGQEVEVENDDEEEDEVSCQQARQESLCWQLVLALLVGTCWALAAQFTSRLQIQQDYQKPLFITLCHSVSMLPMSTLPLLFFPSLRRYRPLLSHRDLRCLFILSVMDFVANFCFTLALSMTNTPSALALEQLTAVCIAVLSYFLFNERFNGGKIGGMALAIAGSLVVVYADTFITGEKPPHGSNPVLGDMLAVLGTCPAAALYMVYLKFWYPKFSLADVLQFFRLKSVLLIMLEGLAVYSAHTHMSDPYDESFAWPSTTLAWTYLVGGALGAAGFNLSLTWCILKFTPLSARLSILLGIPVAFILDLVLGGLLNWLRLFGIVFVLSGLALFQREDTNTSQHNNNQYALAPLQSGPL